MKNLKHYIKLVEAGEPADPSRRGFLRAMGAAGAAAAMPGTALKALATPAAAVAAPAQAAAAGAAAASQSTLLNGLWAAAVNYMADKEPEPTSDWDDEEDFGPAWDDEIADAGPQGEDGMMPWGDDYGMLTTPKGRKYLYTANAGESGIIAYEKDGEPRVIELAWDREARDYGEAVGTTDPDEDVDLYYDFSDKHGNVVNNKGELVDYIIDGGDASPSPQAHEKSDDNKMSKSLDTTPLDLARLAGLAKKGIETVKGAGASDSEEPAPTVKHMGPVQYAKDTPALPAPSDDNVLKPNLKQQQAEPVKKNNGKQ